MCRRAISLRNPWENRCGVSWLDRRSGYQPAEALRSATDRFLKATARNMEEVLGLVAARRDDPAVVEALTFVIKAARAGPGDESYRAMEILREELVRRSDAWNDCRGRPVPAA